MASPLARAAAFCERFGLGLPILLAPMAGAAEVPNRAANAPTVSAHHPCHKVVVRRHHHTQVRWVCDHDGDMISSSPSRYVMRSALLSPRHARSAS